MHNCQHGPKSRAGYGEELQRGLLQQALRRMTSNDFSPGEGGGEGGRGLVQSITGTMTVQVIVIEMVQKT